MKIRLLFLAAIILLLSGCTGNMAQEEVWLLEKEKAMTFFDGESVSLWRKNDSADKIYKLDDGTVLLIEQEPVKPENVYVGGVASFDGLTQNVREAIMNYYDEQGLLYDVSVELEKAYAEYLACKVEGRPYNKRHVCQSTVPTASNEKIICFLTTVTLPVNNQMAQKIRLGTVFDRITGSEINKWELFNISEEKARERLVKALAATSPDLVLTEMEAALKPEYIIIFTDNMEVTFPSGSLPSQKNSYTAGITFEDISSILKPWAFPVSD